MIEPSANLVVALVAIGMGVSFLAADPESPTSRALALCLSLIGITKILNVLGESGNLPSFSLLWPRLFSITEAGAMAAGFEWILRVGRTAAPIDAQARRVGEGLLRAAQALVGLYAVFGVALPALRTELLDANDWTPELFLRPEYYLFTTPFYLSLVFGSVRTVQLLLLDPDPAERVRVLGLLIATPFLVAGFVVAPPWEYFATTAGELIFLGGSVRYHVLQGQRGQFLARFLSPQVAHLIRVRGLASTMHRSRVQLSVVACDLRGFTSFAETAAPEEVMQLVTEYYETIGKAVADFGGTIKDLAGDGILCLVGAPIAYPDHPRRAIAMALEMRKNADAVLGRWRRLGLDLGLGIGIASGFVTVGAIGGAGRLEYAAVGPAVNLAARLADRAEAGQVLVDQRTVGLVGPDGHPYRFERVETAELKGFLRAVQIFAVASSLHPPDS